MNIYGVTQKPLLIKYLAKQGTTVDWKRVEMFWGEPDAPLLALEVTRKYIDNRNRRSVITRSSLNDESLLATQ